MAFFKRLSDSLWAYVSPTKPKATINTPQTAPHLRKTSQVRRGSYHDIVRESRSMSPVSRVDSWRMNSAEASTSRKRKVLFSSNDGHRNKIVKMDDSMDYTPEYENAEDTDMIDQEFEPEGMDIEDHRYDGPGAHPEVDEESDYEDEDIRDDYSKDEDMDDISADMSSIQVSRIKSSPPSARRKSLYNDDDDPETDMTVVATTEENNSTSPFHRKITTLPEELLSRDATTEVLQAAGWEDNHIVLVQKLAGRGFEPLLPQHWKVDFRYLPDALFSKSNKAFISSVRNQHNRGTKALAKLFEIGGRVRDGLLEGSVRSPAQEAVRSIQAYRKWANQDANLDPKSAIPLISFEASPANTSTDMLISNIHHKMSRLHTRYHHALRAERSIEIAPSTDTTKLSYPIPQIYGFIASHTLLVLVAYRPDASEAVGGAAEHEGVKVVANFDMADKDYDVWNALAVGIILCHLRNVQREILEDTGLGAKVVKEEEGVDDPDV
ncbi:hypothetical protein LTR86_001605 [Recurvomyces mirabilis]|nr:hypothetical protein LTR86_001605 [Recurvomyces mirabilis]